MVAPSVRLSASGPFTTSTTCAVTVTGTPADGELILAICQDNENPPFAAPAITGFSTIASIATADWNPLYILGKIASSEGTNPTYTSTWSGGAGGLSPCMGILVIQNAKTSGLPTNTASTHDTTASTTFSIPALTTAVNDSLDLVAVTHDGNVGSNSNNYSAWGSSLVEVLDFSDTAGTSGYAAFGVAAVSRATAGSQAATTVTSVANDKNVAIRIEVEPAAAGAAGQPTQKRMGGVPWMGQHGAGFPSAIQRWIRRESGLQVPAYYRERRAV